MNVAAVTACFVRTPSQVRLLIPGEATSLALDDADGDHGSEGGADVGRAQLAVDLEAGALGWR